MQAFGRNLITKADALNECRMSNKEFRMTKFDAFAKSRKTPFSVIPANPGSGSGTGAGIQEKQAPLDPGFRRGDGFDDFTRSSSLMTSIVSFGVLHSLFVILRFAFEILRLVPLIPLFHTSRSPQDLCARSDTPSNTCSGKGRSPDLFWPA